MKTTLAVLTVASLVALPALAQSSPSYTLAEHTFNAGGRPEQGLFASSASYRITLDSVGDGMIGRNLASASFSMDSSFTTSYRPPGEVAGLLWSTDQDFHWNAEPSAGTYNVYRDLLSVLPGNSGSCWVQNLGATNHTDPDTPAAGLPFFYLITVENRLAEEGTRGFWHDGTPRSDAGACP